MVFKVKTVVVGGGASDWRQHTLGFLESGNIESLTWMLVTQECSPCENLR